MSTNPNNLSWEDIYSTVQTLFTRNYALGGQGAIGLKEE